jgi:hypothetical protein
MSEEKNTHSFAAHIESIDHTLEYHFTKRVDIMNFLQSLGSALESGNYTYGSISHANGKKFETQLFTGYKQNVAKLPIEVKSIFPELVTQLTTKDAFPETFVNLNGVNVNYRNLLFLLVLIFVLYFAHCKYYGKKLY